MPNPFEQFRSLLQPDPEKNPPGLLAPFRRTGQDIPLDDTSGEVGLIGENDLSTPGLEPTVPMVMRRFGENAAGLLESTATGDPSPEEAMSLMGIPAAATLGSKVVPGAIGSLARTSLGVAGVQAAETPLRTAKNATLETGIKAIRDVDKASGQVSIQPTTQNRGLSLMDIVYNPEFQAPRSNKITAQSFLQQRARKATKGRALDVSDPKDFETVSDTMFNEVQAALQVSGNANQWYKDTLKQGINEVAKEFPEIATDPAARDAFLFATAVTSNGQPVLANSGFALKQYEAFRKTGKFPIFGNGKETPAMQRHFQHFNDLVDDHGLQDTLKLMNTKFTVKELRAAGLPVPAQEGADEVVYGSYLFGAKLGNGFYQNLRGNFDQLTADRWFARTWGRMTGTLLRDDKGLELGMDKFKAALSRAPSDEVAKYTNTPVSDLLQDDEALSALVGKIHSKWAREAPKGKTKGTFGNQTDLKKTARNIDKLLGDGVDMPGGPKMRSQMRQVVQDVQAKLAKDGIDLDIADIQAIIWFPEKELYSKLGAAVPNRASDDYASTFKDLIGQRRAARQGRAGQQPGGDNGPQGVPQGGSQSPQGLLEFDSTAGRDFLDQKVRPSRFVGRIKKAKSKKEAAKKRAASR